MLKITLTNLFLVCALSLMTSSIMSSLAVAQTGTPPTLSPQPVPTWIWGKCDFWAWGGYGRLDFKTYSLNLDGNSLKFEAEVDALRRCRLRQGTFQSANVEGKTMKLFALKHRHIVTSVAYAGARFSSDPSPKVALRLPFKALFTRAELMKLQAGETVKTSTYLLQEGDTEGPTGTNFIWLSGVRSTYRLDFELNVLSQTVSLLNLTQVD